MIETAFFYLFSITMVASAAMVIVGRNTVHSVLFLILAFLNAAGLFLLAGAEFLAMIMVIVYVGAVAVLFLFVVMMLDTNFNTISKGLAKYGWVGSFVGLILAGELITVSILWASHPQAPKKGAQALLESATNAKAIGKVLYTDYFYSFQLSGIILLVAMVGAIVLTLRTRTNIRRQNYHEQLSRSPDNTLQMVKVVPGEGIDPADFLI